MWRMMGALPPQEWVSCSGVDPCYGETHGVRMVVDRGFSSVNTTYKRRMVTTTRNREKRKTPVTDEYNLLQSDSRLVQVNGCFGGGFFVGDVQVEGSVICFGDVWFHWSPKRYEDITIDSLALLDVVVPVPELLILGCGNSIRTIPEDLMKGLRERYVSVEAVDTKNAAATFNILNQEGRSVVGAFIPLT